MQDNSYVFQKCVTEMTDDEKYAYAIESLQRKIKKARKPYEEGYNEGILCAVSVIENFFSRHNTNTLCNENKYRYLLENLCRELRTDCFNRDSGFNAAILCAMSKIKEVYGNTI